MDAQIEEAQALQRVLDTLDGNVRLVFALTDRVAQAGAFITDARIEEYTAAVSAWYEGVPAHRHAEELEMSRRHPYIPRLVRDLHQLIHPGGGDRGHVDPDIGVLNGITFERWVVAKNAMLDLVLIARLKVEDPSTWLREETRRLYRLMERDEPEFLDEWFRVDADHVRIEEETCSNLFYTDEILYPPCIQCPFCAERMQLSHTIPQAILLITESGLKYGRHFEFSCKNAENCRAPYCSRHYDAVSYKEKTNGDALFWQLERPGWSVPQQDGHPNHHEHQPRHETLKYIQVSARVFVSVELVKDTGLSIFNMKGSFDTMASKYLDLHGIKPSILGDLVDEVFESLVETVVDDKATLAIYLRRGFYLFVLTGQWLKQRYGEPLFVRLEAEDLQHARFPPIDLDYDGPMDRFPLLRFIREWGGRLKMGEAVEPTRSRAVNPRIVNFASSVDGAISLYLDIFQDSFREEGLHVCDDCLKEHPVTGKVVYGANIDGVSMRMTCCHEGEHERNACRQKLRSNHDHYCEAHAERNIQCQAGNCGANAIPPTRACQEHFDLWVRHFLASKGSVRWRNLHYLKKMGKKGMPQFNTLLEGTGFRAAVSDLLSENPEFLLSFQDGEEPLDGFIARMRAVMQGVISDEISPPTKFQKKFTCCDVYYTRSCGFVISRRLAYRSESLETVLVQLLIATCGGRIDVPSFCYYDRACAFMYYLAGLVARPLLPEPQEVHLPTRVVGYGFGHADCARLLSKLNVVCDPFHYNRHHHQPYLAGVCDFYCCPNFPPASPLLYNLFNYENPGEWERMFNCEIQESVAAEFGPFDTMVHSANLLHGEFILEGMVLIKNEKLVKKEIKQNKNPTFVHPLHIEQFLHQVHNVGLQDPFQPAQMLDPNQVAQAAHLFNHAHPEHNNHMGLNEGTPYDHYAPAANAQFPFGQ